MEGYLDGSRFFAELWPWILIGGLIFMNISIIVAYCIGKLVSNKKWEKSVEHMPQVISQEIREKKDLEIKYLQGRYDELCKKLERHEYINPSLRAAAASINKAVKS